MAEKAIPMSYCCQNYPWCNHIHGETSGPAASAAAGALSGAMAPIGCLKGAVVALFWITMFLLILFFAWVYSLPTPPK